MEFSLVLTGQALAGHSTESIRQRLLDTLKLPAEQAEALLPPARRVIKRGLDQAGAERLAARLRLAGLDVEVRGQAPSPTAQPAPAPPPDPLGVLAQLASQGLKRPRLSPQYALHLLIVTLCCLLVPMFYTLIVVALGGGLAWYVTHIHHYVNPFSNAWLLLLIYVVPGTSGAILLLFLARPLFIGTGHQPRPLKLDLAAEPRLRQTIEQLCQALGLRPPVEVHLSNTVNAGVYFERGWSGFFSGRKVLTLGLPLVAGLSVEQFVGVLAHEFGHFTQRLGMRCHFLLNRVNAWLDTRGNARDPWDDRLDAWFANDELWWAIRLALLIGRAGIGVSRWLMRGCLWLSFRFSRSLSRQMEFDADRYETLISGSNTFRSTALQLRRLNLALNQVDDQNAASWRERRLLRDMPDAAALAASEMNDAALQHIEAQLAEQTTRYWDTHPADLERIQHSAALKAPGHLHDPRPAPCLFEQFAEHCQNVTRGYYRSLGLDYSADQLQDSQSIRTVSKQRESALDALNEWTGRQWREQPWLGLHMPVLPEHQALGLQAVIDELRKTSPEISNAWQSAEKDEELRLALAFCAQLDREGVQAWVSENQQFDSERDNQRLRDINSGNTAAQRYLRSVASLYRRRIELNITETEPSTQAAWRLLGQLSQLFGEIALLLEARLLAGRFLEAHQEHGEALTDRLSHDALVRYQDLALRLLKKADAIPQHFFDGETLGGYLRLRCPRLNAQAGEPMDFYQHSGTLLDSLKHAQRRAFSELAQACDQNEKRQGIRGIRLVLRQATSTLAD